MNLVINEFHEISFITILRINFYCFYYLFNLGVNHKRHTKSLEKFLLISLLFP